VRGTSYLNKFASQDFDVASGFNPNFRNLSIDIQDANSHPTAWDHDRLIGTAA
jgi:hypothetical protein